MATALDHSAADVIQKLLIDLSIGVTPDGSTNWSTYINTLPENPISAISVNDQAGIIQGHQLIDGVPMEHLGVQIFVRGMYDRTATSVGKKLGEVMNLPTQSIRQSVTVDSGGATENIYRVNSVVKTSGPIKINTGDRRTLYSVNFVTSIELTA